ncbi:MAG: phosphate/phosphite/phosphonate ABC transporter substrate-binding protein, partial [Bdellovibrionales bacterium]
MRFFALRGLKTLSMIVLLLVAVVSCTRDKGPLGTASNPVKFFFVPSVDAKVLTEKTKHLKEYLEANTQYKYKIQVPTSFVAVVEAFGTARADVASVNTFGYILANEKYGAEAWLTVERYGHSDYKGQFIARADSKINKLTDIDGKKIAYVDPASTSGYLLPATMLKKASVKPAEMMFATRHDNV